MFRDVPECSGMFRDVSECSGMFRNVPCSWFYRRPSHAESRKEFGANRVFLSDLDDKQFSVLKKCRYRSKFDCLIFEMLFIKELNPELNTQKDSIRAKLFTWLCGRILCYLHTFILLPVSTRSSFKFIFIPISYMLPRNNADVTRCEETVFYFQNKAVYRA